MNGDTQATDLTPIDRLVDQFGSGMEATIPLLQGIQDAFGYLPLDTIRYLTTKTGIPASHLFGVATFYNRFRLTPVGKNMIRVCLGTACHVQGGGRVHTVTREILEMEDETDTTADRLFTVEPVACLGCCSLAPVVMVNETTHGRLDAPATRKLIRKYNKAEKKAAAEQS